MNRVFAFFSHTRRAAKFGMVGLSGVAVNMLVLWLLKEQTRAPLWLASACAIESSLLNNFFWNYYWTFGDRQAASLRALAKYHFAVGLAASANFVILWILHRRFGVHYLLANAVGILSGFASNYLFSNFWVFKKRSI